MCTFSKGCTNTLDNSVSVDIVRVDQLHCVGLLP